MVSKESIRAAKKAQDQWIIQNRSASLKSRIIQSAKSTKQALEAEIGLHTLPSIIAPMPEAEVKKLKLKIDKFKRKYSR